MTFPPCFGGCQLFLDLTGVFDATRRQHLWAALKLLELPMELIHLSMTWHTCTSYVVQWKGREKEVATYKGV